MSFPSYERVDVLNAAVNLMRDTTWKNTVAPAHDHTLGGELAMVSARDGRYVAARNYNCPRCGDDAADRIWPLALAEAERRLALKEAS